MASYRAGYLAEDRTALEQALAEGRLRGLATTNALELGIDIAGLDAVVLAGFPGTVASFWQQAGRSGRRGQGALVVLIARDDPLDTYLVHHPAALLDKPVERVVIDPANPYILGPQLLCAATELPLDEAEVRISAPRQVAQGLVDDGLLRRRNGKYFPAPGVRTARRGGHPGLGGRPDRHRGGGHRAAAGQRRGRARPRPRSIPGAVYLHQGETYVVDSLDIEDGIAFVHAEDPGYATFARELTDIDGHRDRRTVRFRARHLGRGAGEGHPPVVGYLRRRLSGEVIDFVELDMPEHMLPTAAVMYTITPDALPHNGIDPQRIPGSLHAAEHAAIGLLPLVASCDRGDIGGLSTAIGPDGLPTVFVYDGYPGGAGFAERGFRQARTWLGATAGAIEACECPSGCPSCVQSPKCGNGNDPLDKAGAVRVLRLVLAELGHESR